MKLNKLLPIVALSGIATVAIPLASCSINDSNKWTQFEFKTDAYDGNPGFQSETTLNMKKGKKYTASFKLQDETYPIGGDSLCVIITDNTQEKIYDFTNESNFIVKIDNQTVEAEYKSFSGRGMIEVNPWLDTYAGKDFYFQFDCVSDLENALIYIIFPS